MSERLAFSFSGIRRDLRERIDWVRAPEKGTLSEAAAAYLPPAELPNWGFWGVFAFTALLFFRPQDTVPALAPWHLPELVAIGALIAMVAHRVNRRLPVVLVSRDTVAVAAHGSGHGGDGSVFGLAGRRAPDVHRRLRQGRAGIHPDGQQRQEHQGAAMAHLAHPLRHGLRGRARRPRLCQRQQSDQRRAAARVDFGADGQPERSRDEHGHVRAAGGDDCDLSRAVTSSDSSRRLSPR